MDYKTFTLHNITHTSDNTVYKLKYQQSTLSILNGSCRWVRLAVNEVSSGWLT